jgi:plasmid stability protein
VKRTQIQLDEATYQALRRRAYEEQRSISAVARRILARALAPAARRLPAAGRFSFVGAGRSRQGKLAPVSERHDEALAEAISPRKKR